MYVFGKRLKEIRKKAHITQQQLGDMVGVTKVSICCYENGTRTPTLETLIDLADSLNVQLNYLLGVDALAIDEDNKNNTLNIAKDEIELIRELRKHIKLYEKMLDDPKRTMDYFEQRIR